MDLTWQCVEATQAADVVEWRPAGQLGAATLAATWLENALSRIPEGCIEACSPSDDCFHGACVGTDGSNIVYDQTIVELEEADGTYYTAETRVEIIPVEGTGWDLLTVDYTKATAFRTDGSSSRAEDWIVAWQELLVPEWPQDASFVVHASTETSLDATTAAESWLDPTCGWSSSATTTAEGSAWTIQMQTETVEVTDPAADCADAAWSVVDGVDEGFVDRDTWAALDGDPCAPVDDTGGSKDDGDGGCGCGTPGAPGGAGLLLLVAAGAGRRRR